MKKFDEFFNLLKMFEVRMLSNSNANFVTFLLKINSNLDMSIDSVSVLYVCNFVQNYPDKFQTSIYLAAVKFLIFMLYQTIQKSCNGSHINHHTVHTTFQCNYKRSDYRLCGSWCITTTVYSTHFCILCCLLCSSLLFMACKRTCLMCKNDACCL